MSLEDSQKHSGFQDMEKDSEVGPTSLEKTATSTSGKGSPLPLWRKYIVVGVLAWMTLCASFSSTSLLSVANEIAMELDTTKEVINVTTGAVVFMMGCSSFVWMPISKIFGFRIAYNTCIVTLVAFTIAAAVAPDISSFATVRILSGICGTFFHVSGQVMLAELFIPTERGTATGFFLCGSVLGPPLGPCFAGIIVTISSWRTILWIQAIMAGVGLILSMTLVPPRTTEVRCELRGLTFREFLKDLDPSPVVKVMKYPNISITHLSCGFLSWSQYFLLSAPRQIITTQFHLNSPLSSGLFYLAPSAGFLLGTLVGGRYSDMTVRKWIVKRENVRLPQDRLRSGFIAFFFITPASTLVYGWTLQCAHLGDLSGGLAVPLVMAFFIAAGLLTAFASLNTYCAEAVPKQRSEVVAGKYIVQYTFAAVAIAGALPLLNAVGVGAASTIGAVLVILSGILTSMTAKYGLALQTWAETRWEDSR